MTGTKKKQAVLLTAIATGTMLNPLNSSMISLALHSIQKDYHLSFATVSWLVSGFYLASAVAQPVTGKIGDLIGSKKTFLIGLLIVAASAVGAPLAPAFSVLLLMRLLQSVGSSAVYPSGVAIIRDGVAHEKQASALAVLSIFASVMTAFGPTVGGFLIVWGGWPTIFTVNFPFILISFVLGWFIIPKDVKKENSQIKQVIRRLDIPGICLFAGGLVFLLWFLLSFDTSVHYLSGVIGILMIGFFIWYELRAKTPFINIRLLAANRTLSLVYIQFILLNVFNYCLFFGLPSYFQSGMHLSIQASGAMMLFMSVASIIVSLLTGRWVDRSGTRRPVAAGALLTFVSAVIMLAVSSFSPLSLMAVIMILFGAGYGIGNVALQAAMVEASPKNSVGTTSGLFQTCRYLGSILSSVVLGLVFGKAITPHHLFVLSTVLTVVGVCCLIMSWSYSKVARETAV